MLFLFHLFFACNANDKKSDVEAEASCDGSDAMSQCLSPTQDPEYYISQSSAYFDTMDYRETLEDWPPYSEFIARWEWSPWLKLTAFTQENIELTDTFLQLYPSIVTDRECRFFDTQPFGRCYVVFYYDAHEGKPCPIYEEFTFNNQGEITFIEAWSDVDNLRPQEENDPWAEAQSINRLSTKIPGLGNATGAIDIQSSSMLQAAEEDADIADFLYRANNWHETWLEEYAASDETMWSDGCGW